MTYIHGCGGSGNIVGTAYNFPYSDTREANGATKTWTAPCTGKFKFEAWGAQGNQYSGLTGIGGKGAYVSGVLSINEGISIYAYVGEFKQTSIVSSFNAGSTGGRDTGGGSSRPNGYGGGGATDFRVNSGSWNSDSSKRSRILIAGGGGGGSDYIGSSGGTGYANGGYAGGLTGGNGYNGIASGEGGTANIPPTGGSQVSGGSTSRFNRTSSFAGENGSFGAGGNSASTYGSGGGGGYWGGGGGGVTPSSVDSGAGGSSYISGYKGCVAIISASSTSPRKNSSGTTCTESLAASDVSCSYHYSGYIFTDTVMKAGNEFMPAPGGGNETGHSGNGYARITVVE